MQAQRTVDSRRFAVVGAVIAGLVAAGGAEVAGQAGQAAAQHAPHPALQRAAGAGPRARRRLEAVARDVDRAAARLVSVSVGQQVENKHESVKTFLRRTQCT